MGATPPPGGWGKPVTELTPQATSWPALTVWQGMDDRIVNRTNALACVAQWLEVRGIDESRGRLEEKPWGRLQSWKVAGELKVALYLVRNIGHGLPIKKRTTSTRRSEDPFVLPAEISAPAELMRLWGLAKHRA